MSSRWLLFSNVKVTSSTTSIAILIVCRVRFIYPSFNLLLSWNPYKLLHIWSVVLNSIHYELVESTIKHDSTKSEWNMPSFLQVDRIFFLLLILLATKETLTLALALSFPNLGISLLSILERVLLIIIIMSRTWRIFHYHVNTSNILENPFSHLKFPHEFR